MLLTHLAYRFILLLTQVASASNKTINPIPCRSFQIHHTPTTKQQLECAESRLRNLDSVRFASNYDRTAHPESACLDRIYTFIPHQTHTKPTPNPVCCRLPLSHTTLKYTALTLESHYIALLFSVNSHYYYYYCY